MKARSLVFTSPSQVSIQEQSLPKMGEDQVLVQTIFSLISPGTEMLIYRGQFPRGLADPNDPFSSNLNYPLKFGYACVGKVIEVGKNVDPGWLDQRVFAFQSHGSHFFASPESLHLVPEGCPLERACFLANMETAVNLIQDAAPILGESAMVFGQGIVGLLTTALLAEFPLQATLTADRYPSRREVSLSLGITASFDPVDEHFQQNVREILPDGADLSLELSGSPAALNAAIALAGFGGRIVVGSWYGGRPATLDLGGTFHRSRLKLISSQVSTIAASLSARWNKARRFDTAWSALARVRPERWITQRFRLEEADRAYRLLDQSPQDCIQIIFEYD
ncbi:MAG TPA: zinc-binding dehydrogenase [Anaerolineales bacterium]|jgi:2-desacetyl-2-hydroxyethyl bacteriochlorophyllide A dehydrogenase|nr:zinc-binding dehydrogenase [Anaerolineales bacterium]